jgi:ATP synthase protein I
VIGLHSKAIRTVLRWQVLATAVLAVIAGALAGVHGALSAVLGGAVSFAGGAAFAAVASLSRAETGPGVMAGALRAEAAKIVVIVFLLWLVMSSYESVVAIVFFGTFIVATVLFSAAFFVPDDGTTK